MPTEDLNHDQRRFLNAILDHRIEHKKWPTLHLIERKLRRELDAIRVASTLTDRYGQQLANQSDQEVVLPFDAIQLCDRAEEFYAIMPKLVAVMWDIFDTTEEKPVINSDEVRARGWTDEEIADAYNMLRYEVPFSGSGMYKDEQEWRVDIRNTIRDYQGIQNARDYIDRRNKVDAELRVPVQQRGARGMRPLHLPLRMPSLLSGVQSIRVTKPSVFIVHGHDEALKNDVARTLEKLGLDPIILHEKADQGQTIIEKLELHSDVEYAVVLITPDDDHVDNITKAPVKRARQNVILELGFFLAQLGRERVFILRKDDPHLELPSDYQGVIYTLADTAGAWRYRLARELREGGFDADANALD